MGVRVEGGGLPSAVFDGSEDRLVSTRTAWTRKQPVDADLGDDAGPGIFTCKQQLQQRSSQRSEPQPSVRGGSQQHQRLPGVRGRRSSGDDHLSG